MAADGTQVREQDAPSDGAPTTELMTPAAGGRCPNCQTPLASDQRYCVNCGERRGKPRFSFASMAAQAAPAAASEGPPPRRPRLSAGATLVAGVATLLLALGVGVLIGHTGANTTGNRAAQVITVGGGGTAGTASTPGAAASVARHVANGKKQKRKAPKVTVVRLTPKVQKAAAAAASKALGGAAPKVPTITVGQHCPPGTAGCQGGKFTGNFFGP